MQLLGHSMFIEYLEKLRSQGRRSFTSEQIAKDLETSFASIRSGLSRLKKDGKLISPAKGLYIIIPPECQPYGSIPAEELVPLLMKHLQSDYYVALLSAATYFGAAHQKPARFQIISNQRIKHSLKFGQVAIEIIYKDSLEGLPTKDFIVNTGYLKVATPELIALDLFKYSKRAAGISHIATVLTELLENIDGKKLIELAEKTGQLFQLQRIGYIIEKIEVMDEKKKETLLAVLSKYVKKANRSFIYLLPSYIKKGSQKSKLWKIIENTDFESDL